MSYIRLANFFQVFEVSSTGSLLDKGRYNNGMPGKSITHNRITYDYLSFIYQGAAKNRTGDNLEAQLVLAVNDISNGLGVQAVRNKWQVRMFSAVMNNNGSVNRVLTEENWLAASMTYDNETVEVILSSAIDAVGANAPTRVLTRDLVGHLPVTGNIQTL